MQLRLVTQLLLVRHYPLLLQRHCRKRLAPAAGASVLWLLQQRSQQQLQRPPGPEVAARLLPAVMLLPSCLPPLPQLTLLVLLLVAAVLPQEQRQQQRQQLRPQCRVLLRWSE